MAEACSGQLIYHFNFLVPVFASELQFVHELILHSQSGDADKVVRIKGDEDDNEEDEEDYDDDEEGDDDDDEGDDDDFEDIADDESPEELAERFAAIKAAASAVFATVDSQGVGFLLSELSGLIEHEEDPSGRRWGCWILEQFLKGTSADFDEYTPLILRFLMSRVAETNKEVQIAMVDALTALVNASQLDNLMRHIDFMRNCMTSTCSDARHRPGMSELLAPSGSSSAPNSFILPIFSTPKALDPFVALLLHALLNGSANIRESAADGLTEVLASTDAVALKPYLIKVTGPLIRVLGDRYPSEVKAAILRALSVLLDKGGAGLKAFAPQLQTTFVKNLAGIYTS